MASHEGNAVLTQAGVPDGSAAFYKVTWGSRLLLAWACLILSGSESPTIRSVGGERHNPFWTSSGHRRCFTHSLRPDVVIPVGTGRPLPSLTLIPGRADGGGSESSCHCCSSGPPILAYPLRTPFPPHVQIAIPSSALVLDRIWGKPQEWRTAPSMQFWQSFSRHGKPCGKNKLIYPPHIQYPQRW